jgi:hypothetical protein
MTSRRSHSTDLLSQPLQTPSSLPLGRQSGRPRRLTESEVPRRGRGHARRQPTSPHMVLVALEGAGSKFADTQTYSGSEAPSRQFKFGCPHQTPRRRLVRPSDYTESYTHSCASCVRESIRDKLNSEIRRLPHLFPVSERDNLEMHTLHKRDTRYEGFVVPLCALWTPETLKEEVPYRISTTKSC